MSEMLSSSMPAKGSTLAGRYVLLEEKGQGGIATVYQALNLQTNEMLALKVLHLPPTLSEDEREGRIQRFENEATIMGLLDHPHIMKFHELIVEGHCYAMVLELLAGEGLDQLAPRLRHTPGALLKLVDQLAEALEYIHARGIIHLDLKPENVMVVDQGQNVKLLDFGIARIEGMETQISRNALVGTVGYMSPEQLQNSRLTQAQSDIYSLGVTLYELFTGMMPYNADSHGAAILMVLNQEPPPPVQLNPLIGHDLNTLIQICMHKQPQHRFATCRQFRQLLRVLLQRVFYENAPPDAAARPLLPQIHLFSGFGLYNTCSEMIKNQASGQCLIWNAYQEGGIWFQNGNLLYADIKNKSIDPEWALKDIVCWESGNFLFIPGTKLPPDRKAIRKNAYDLMHEAFDYHREYHILWEMYQKDDIPEVILMPGSSDKLTEVVMTLLECIDGRLPVGKLHAMLPFHRLEVLAGLQSLEDRQFIFVERQR